jgi:very-short-patch-repair endonuclease
VRAEASAKRMRRTLGVAEKHLWKQLRTLEWDGTHFRRQVPMGNYVVDFVSHRHRLIVEVDGPVHELPDVAKRDAERDRWLESRGYSVFRVANQNVLADVRLVMTAIIHQLRSRTPTPRPTPQGGGGQT